MKGRICLCPASIAWIKKHLKKTARAQFSRLLARGSVIGLGKRKGRHVRTAKQKRATRMLVAFNKRRKRKRRSRNSRR